MVLDTHTKKEAAAEPTNNYSSAVDKPTETTELCTRG